MKTSNCFATYQRLSHKDKNRIHFGVTLVGDKIRWLMLRTSENIFSASACDNKKSNFIPVTKTFSM